MSDRAGQSLSYPRHNPHVRISCDDHDRSHGWPPRTTSAATHIPRAAGWSAGSAADGVEIRFVVDGAYPLFRSGEDRPDRRDRRGGGMTNLLRDLLDRLIREGAEG